MKSEHVIATKTHEGWNGSPKFNPSKYDRAIIIVRNVYDSLIAEFKRRHLQIGKGINTAVEMDSNIFEDSTFLEVPLK